MKKIEKALQEAERIARDDRHGYDQINRWGDDFDCSSLVLHCLEEAGGIPVITKGKGTYTGNMLSALKKCGFVEVDKNDLKRGDVLLNKKHHTAFYAGENKMVQASINEKGTTTGGKKGDQTGREIAIVPYKEPSYGWDVVLRFPEEDEDTSNSSEDAPISSPKDSDEEFYIVKKGDTLSKIGAKYGVSVSDLAKWNSIENPNLIKIGQKIVIKKQEGEQTQESFRGIVSTNSKPLNIREGSSMSSRVLGTLPKGAEVKIAYETAGWGKLFGRAGFVSMKFITKI